MKIQSVFVTGIIAFCLASPSISLAEGCAPREILATKPTLAGRHEDMANGFGISWHSAAGNNASSNGWVLDYGICNIGKGSLIVDWQKAYLSNDAFSALASGKEMYNRISVGKQEPTEGGATIEYGGYVKKSAETTIYNLPLKEAETPVLQSDFGGEFMLGDLPPQSSPSQVNSSQQLKEVRFNVSIEAINKGDGYILAAAIKESTPVNLRLLISTVHNESLAKALTKFEPSGVSTILPLAKIAQVAKGSNFERFSNTPFVSIPSVITDKGISLFVPVKASKIELATVLVIYNDVYPVLTGKVSLFQ